MLKNVWLSQTSYTVGSNKIATDCEAKVVVILCFVQNNDPKHSFNLVEECLLYNAESTLPHPPPISRP